MLMMLNSAISFADQQSDLEFINQKKQMIENIQKDEGLKHSVDVLQQNAVKPILLDAQAKYGVKNGDASGALYFVSFSIPDDGLKEMMVDARGFHIPSVLNGFHENDIRKTAVKIFNLTKEGNKGGVMIDPRLFSRYNIKAVPALVVTCENNKFDIIYGSARIENALEYISRRGECANKAKEILLARNG